MSSAGRSPEERLKWHTKLCTVRIASHGVKGGSGFFIAPGLILTCAHVASTESGTVADRVSVVWKSDETEMLGTVVAAEPHDAQGRVWRFPDLCVIELAKPFPLHPWVLLGDAGGGYPGSDVHLAGYPAVYDTEPQFQSLSARFDGENGDDGSGFWKLTRSELPPGLSGGPVLDLRHGEVCGVVKTARKPGSDLGGLAVPVSALQMHFPDAWTANKQASGGTAAEWRALRVAVRERYDMVSAVLTDTEIHELVAAAATLGLGRRDLKAWYWRIAGPCAPEPEYEMHSVRDLARALADTRPDDGSPDPLLELYVRLTHRAARVSVEEQHAHADAIARRGVGQTEKLAKLRANLVESDDDHRSQPVILIHLAPSAPKPHKYSLTVWHYDTAGGPTRQIYCEDAPLPLKTIRSRISEVILSTMPDLPEERVRIEFVLPDTMLNHPVEKWDLGKSPRPLGVSYAVVVRSTSRDAAAAQAWRTRSRRIRSHTRLDLRTAMHWVDCHDQRDLTQFNALLEIDPDLPLVALTAWLKGAPLPLALRAAIGVGIPAVLWRHDPCLEHHSSDDHGEGCRGDRYREALAKRLHAQGAADLTMDSLPEFVRRMRAEAVAQYPRDPDHPGESVAILWDDPVHVPWMLTPSGREWA